MGVFILVDYQNQPVDLELVVNKASELGKVLGGKAYGHWVKYPATVNRFHNLGIELIEVPEDGFTHKNSNDIKIAVDAMEILLTMPIVEIFMLVTGDSDFVPLVRKLKMYNKRVAVISRRSYTSALLMSVCDFYFPYEDLVKSEKLSDDKGSDADRENLVSEIAQILKINAIQKPTEEDVKRILNGLALDPKSYSFGTLDQMVKFVHKEIKDSSNGDYEENYQRFVERFICFSQIKYTVETLVEACEKKMPWYPKHSKRKLSLKQLIENMLKEGRLFMGKDGTLNVSAPRRWYIRFQDVQPYPEHRDSFLEEIYKLFNKSDVIGILEAAKSVQLQLNVPRKVANSFAYALKFTGLFTSEDGSDYVSLNMPARLNGSLEDLKRRVEAFYLKRIMRFEVLTQSDFSMVAQYLYGPDPRGSEKLKLIIDFLQSNGEIFVQNNEYIYKNAIFLKNDENETVKEVTDS